MTRILAVITLILLVITLGCGFIIRYGGESFRNAVGGHMILGIVTLVLMVILLVTIFK